MRQWILLFAATDLLMSASSFQLTAVSNDPNRVSGGNVLVRITAPANEVAIVRLNGDLVTEAQAGLQLIQGLKLGSNSLELFRKNETTAAAKLSITNFPITGPVFSGPHEQPFICQTEDFKLPDGTSLGKPLDGYCSAPTVVTYLYRSVNEKPGDLLKPLDSITSLPPDVAITTTSLGETVPYVVRVETGTINRAIYQIATLANGWNRRLLYSFGGGCTGGWYRQGATTGLGLNTIVRGTLADSVLSAGYAYASSTLNVFGNNCQDVTAAETMMMVKEHFIENYGVPLFTFGRGGSGGAYQQIQIAGNYPGLLDGIIPSATFTDVLATIQYLTDAQLLNAYYSRVGVQLTDEQKLAIAGVGLLPSVTRTSFGAGRINPRVFCPPELPEPMRYHPVTNPKGARCDVYDHTVNVYGRDPATGFARRPLDNTGVQYGLQALNSSVITVQQFLDLNEQIGGYDNDGNIVPSRSVADRLALRAAYSTGRVTNGGAGLTNIPIIDLRGYLDLNPNGDLHMKYHSFAFRERLLRANGTFANHVLLTGAPSAKGTEEYTIAKMDEWLTKGSKPADLVDSCFSSTGARIVEAQTFSGGECNKLYPTFPSPRMIAGGPVTNDVLKCDLKPVDFRDYQAPLTDADKLRLKAIFPQGVCDWNKPGVEQQKLAGVWQSF